MPLKFQNVQFSGIVYHLMVPKKNLSQVQVFASGVRKLGFGYRVGMLVFASGVGMMVLASGLGMMVLAYGDGMTVFAYGVGMMQFVSGVGIMLVIASGVEMLVFPSGIGMFVFGSGFGMLVFESGVGMLMFALSGVGMLTIQYRVDLVSPGWLSAFPSFYQCPSGSVQSPMKEHSYQLRSY